MPGGLPGIGEVCTPTEVERRRTRLQARRAVVQRDREAESGADDLDNEPVNHA